MVDEEDARVEHGRQVAARLDEVMPDEASGEVARVYDEIRAALRVPFVNQLFRVLANDPGFLVPAWDAARPVLRTRAFEREADRLRERALLDVPVEAIDVERLVGGDAGRVRAFTDSIHYVLPKLLLTAHLYAALAQGRGGGGHAREELPAGPAPGTVALDLVDPDEAPAEARRVLQTIKRRHGHPAVASFYRALSSWPALLDEVWSRVEPHVETRAFAAERRALVDAAARAVDRDLVARATPLEAVSSETASLLALFGARVVPDLMIDVALVKAAFDGRDAARASRLSTVDALEHGAEAPRAP